LSDQSICAILIAVSIKGFQKLEQERRNIMAGNGKRDKGNKEKKKKPKLNIKEKRKLKNEKKNK
jgi:hypothetical protein